MKSNCVHRPTDSWTNSIVSGIVETIRIHLHHISYLSCNCILRCFHIYLYKHMNKIGRTAHNKHRRGKFSVVLEKEWETRAIWDFLSYWMKGTIYIGSFLSLNYTLHDLIIIENLPLLGNRLWNIHCADPLHSVYYKTLLIP